MHVASTAMTTTGRLIVISINYLSSLMDNSDLDDIPRKCKYISDGANFIH